MLQIKQKGFTLIEILLSLGILALGLSGILTLFPVGLDAGQKAIQDITSTLIAESLMDVLRASILQKHPDGNLPFIFDGFNDCVTIPAGSYSSNNYGETTIKGRCGRDNEDPEKERGALLSAYNKNTDEESLRQYGYRVYIIRTTNHLYDVTIAIYRNGNFENGHQNDPQPIRRFYSQIMIPEAN